MRKSKALIAMALDARVPMLCPYCNTKNWVYMGNLLDQTNPYPEAMSCYNCKKTSWLDEVYKEEAEYNAHEGDHDPITEIEIGEGRENP